MKIKREETDFFRGKKAGVVNNFVKESLSSLLLVSYLIDTDTDIVFYYIHTEKYSPKSYVVTFHTQISSSQSGERTMVFTGEKNDRS